MHLYNFFPSVVAQFSYPEATDLNSELLDLIQQERERSTESEPRITTVNNGWQSKIGLLNKDYPAIQSLRAFIEKSMAEYFEQVTKNTALDHKKFRYNYNGWATVLHEGGFQSHHVHSRVDLVGIYCVAKPEPRDEASIGGALTLIDPRAGCLSTRSVWDNNTSISIPPMPGQLFFIPSFLAYQIGLVKGSGDRVTIDFDILVLPNSK